MRDRRLHDHGEDKHPPPCLRPFRCLTFPHVFIISLTCCISHTVCLSGLSGSCFLLALCPPPSICLYNLWTLFLAGTKMMPLSAFFLTSTVPNFLSHSHVCNCISNFLSGSHHFPPHITCPISLGLYESESGPWMHRLQNTEFQAVGAFGPWCISTYWFGIWIPSHLTMMPFIMYALREWQFIFSYDPYKHWF